MGSTSTNALLAELLVQQGEVLRLTEAAAAGNVMLIAGTRDDPDSFDQAGGKTGPLGFYPVEDVNGETRFFPCMDRLRHEAIDGIDAALAGTEFLGDGLLQSNGGLGETVTLKVPAATTPQAIAGTDLKSAMTPKATADLLAVAIPLYATRALVVAIAGGVPASVAQFRTAGYATVGDRGGASFRRVAAEPAHPGKLRDAIGAWFEQIDFVARPEQFGGFPSSDDCTVQVQAAWDYAAAKVMGGDVEFGPFTYKVGNVQARSGVKAYGAGMLRTKLERPTIGASGPYALVNGIVALEPAASRVSIYDLCMDSLSSTEAQPLLRLRNPRTDIDIQRVKFANAPARWAVRMDQSMDGRAQGEVPTYSNVSITQCRWDNCPSGGILFLPAAKGNQGIKINDNWFDRVGANIIAIYDMPLAGEVKGWDTNFDVTVDRNRVTNCLPTGNNGPIPVELWGCTRYSASDNFIDSGTRGISADGGSSDGVLARNIILNQTQYAYEAGNSRRVTIRDGKAYNCASLIQWTNNVEVRDFTVENMTLIGTGRTVYAPNSGPDALKVDGGNFYNLVLRNVKVIDPVFMRTGFYIKPNAGSSVLLEDCEVISRAANSCVRHFSVSGSGDVTVRRPRSRILMDLSAAHYQSGVGIQIATPVYGTADQGSCRVEQPFCEMAGAVGDFAGLAAIGAFAAAQPMYNVSISDVRLKGAYPSAAIFLPDTSGDVANLFRVARRHYEPLVEEMAWLLASRDEFERYRRVDPTTLTDIERAVRFLYLQRIAFGGRVTGRNFGVRRDQSSRFNQAHLRGELRQLRDRLQPVTIEQLPWSDVVRRYDGADALFYLDPPYDETEGYGVEFGRADYVAMAEQLAQIRGRFVLSINATPFVRETFARFDIAEVETTWTVSSASAGRGTKVTELIIRN
jgi:DNA adenine methylase